MTVEFFRQHIRDQTCPWCDAGPFKALPVHTVKKHGVDKWKLRDLAHLTTRQSMVSEETSERLRETYHPAAARTAGLKAYHESGTRSAPRQTNAGREHRGDILRSWMKENPEAYKKARAKALAANTKRRRSEI